MRVTSFRNRRLNGNRSKKWKKAPYLFLFFSLWAPSHILIKTIFRSATGVNLVDISCFVRHFGSLCVANTGAYIILHFQNKRKAAGYLRQMESQISFVTLLFRSAHEFIRLMRRLHPIAVLPSHRRWHNMLAIWATQSMSKAPVILK